MKTTNTVRRQPARPIGGTSARASYAPQFSRNSWKLRDYMDASPAAKAIRVSEYREGSTAQNSKHLNAFLARIVATEDAQAGETRIENMIRRNAQAFVDPQTGDTDTPRL